MVSTENNKEAIAVERKANSLGSAAKPARAAAAAAAARVGDSPSVAARAGEQPPSVAASPASSISRRSTTPKKSRAATAAATAASASSTPPHSASPAPGASSDAAAEERDYRVAVFGAGGVGKSSIVLRFIKNTFSDAYVPTIEDTYQQVISCTTDGRMAVCTLHIIDTTGSHQFPAMQRLAIARGNAFVLVYSVSSRQSLEELGQIMRTLREVKGDAQMGEVPVMLVGNKADDAQRREVSPETGEALAERWQCGFIETSAKLGEGITELFQRLLALEKRRCLTLTAPDTEGAGAGAKASGSGKRRCAIL